MFAYSRVRVFVYKSAARNRRQQPINHSGETSRINVPRLTTVSGAPKHKKTNDKIVIVKMEGKIYSDILKSVKQTINLNEIGVNIKDKQGTHPLHRT